MQFLITKLQKYRKLLFYYNYIKYLYSLTDDTGKADLDMALDYESTTSLEFPLSTTPCLYEKINKHHLKIHIPGFQPIQTCCPKKTWRKLMKLHCNTSSKIYYLIGNHTIGKQGRSVVVSSPLQVSLN